MQISEFSVVIMPNFSLSLNLELIRTTFDLDEFNVSLFASIQRWRFSRSVFASSCRVFLQMFDGSKQVLSANSRTVERCNSKGKSFIHVMKSRGSKIEPYGTPELTKCVVVLSLSNIHFLLSV